MKYYGMSSLLKKLLYDLFPTEIMLFNIMMIHYNTSNLQCILNKCHNKKKYKHYEHNT